MKSSRESWQWWLHLIETLLLAAASISMIWWIFWGSQSDRSRQVTGHQRPTRPLPTEPISLKGTWPDGNTNARVAVVVYSDYECPACRQAAEDVIPAFKRDFVSTGRVQLAYKHLPLVRIHPSAMLAAVAAECAGAQGRFWAMYESLILGPLELDAASLQRRASRLGLRPLEFENCLSGDSVKRTVEDEVRTALQTGISGTPVFIVGLVQRDSTVKPVKRIDGVGPYEGMRTVISEVLAGAGR